MLRVKSVATLVSSTLLLAACGQIIGLGDYTEVEGNASGKGGQGGSAGAGRGGSSGRGGSTGAAGESGGTGVGGSIAGGGAGEAGASAGQGGTAGSAGEGGNAGNGDAAGQAGEGGVDAGGAGGVSGGGGSAGIEGGSGGAGGAGAGGEGGMPPRVCTEITLGAVFAVDDFDVPDAVQYFTEYTPNLGDPGGDYVAVDFYDFSGYDGRLRGTFDLGSIEDGQYRTCSRCVRVFQDLDSLASKVFYQESGTMVVDSNSDHMNENPLVELSDVTLVEVTIADDYTSTPVSNGECVHIAQATITVPAEELMWDEDECDVLWRDDGYCDCGCGAVDPDCTATTGDVCESCACGTVDDPLPCDATNNWLCEEPVAP